MKALNTNGNGFVLIHGRSNPKLANEISRILGVKSHESVSVFADGEVGVQVPVSLRRKDVFIIQPTAPPANDRIMELLLMIDAARRASANEITAIIPYFGYARQDRKDSPRKPISASLIANLIQEAGADRIATIDIHSDQQQGFIRGPWDNLYASYAFLPILKSKKINNLVIASPDKGGVARATAFARRLKADGVAIVYKERDVNVKNESKALDLIGDVKDKNVILVDDIIDTAGSMINAANLLKSRGVLSVMICATHGLFSGNALEKISNSDVKEILITNTVLQRKEVLKHPKIKVVSIAPLLAKAIIKLRTGKSLSEDLIN